MQEFDSGSKDSLSCFRQVFIASVKQIYSPSHPTISVLIGNKNFLEKQPEQQTYFSKSKRTHKDNLARISLSKLPKDPKGGF